MAKLGYTFYPKDWSSDDQVFELTLIERGFYRELIDMAMLNDNKTELNLKTWARKLNSNINELSLIINNLIELNLIKIKDNIITIPSCEKRLNLIRGGRKGGSKKKPTHKPTSKPIFKPTPKQREIEREIEIKTESKVNIKKGTYNSAYDFLKSNKQEAIEAFEMQNKKSFSDFEKFIENFNNKVVMEQLEFEPDILYARLKMLNANWDKKPVQKFSNEKEKTESKAQGNLSELEKARQMAKEI